MMTPVIKELPEKKLIGKKLLMSLVENRTGELWKSFMPRRKEITNAVGTDLFSMQVYDPLYFKNFSPAKAFVKWAAVEVEDFDSIPDDMESFELPGGLYAVFPYKGLASQGGSAFQYIFSVWLPSSEFHLDDRPHFELLGEKYKNESPDSEEEIWIPVKMKSKSGSPDVRKTES